MALHLMSWGRWASTILESKKALPAELKFCSVIVNEDLCGAGHFTDPLAAESFCSCRSLVKTGSLPDDYTFSANSSFLGATGAYDDCRIHLLNAGEHFASGALSAFMRRKADNGTDVALILLPPSGSNDATSGRILAQIYGIDRYFDACILLDAEATIFAAADEQKLNSYALEVIRLLLIFERSSCMLPLMMRIASPTLSLCLQDISSITVATSLEPLWRQSTVSLMGRKPTEAPGIDFLAFSVSPSRENMLGRVIAANLPARRHIYIPFLPRYEWRHAQLPEGRGKGPQRITGALFGNIFPPRIMTLLRAYKNKYWDAANTDAPVECPDFEARRWLHAHQIPLLRNPISRSILRKAAQRIKKSKQSVKKDGV